MNHSYLSIESIVEDYIANTGNDSVVKSQILRFADDALSRIIPGTDFKHSIALLDVKNYSAPLPNGFKYVLQAGYNAHQEHKVRSEHVVEYTKKIYGSDCKLNLSVECDDCKGLCDKPHEVITVDVDHNFILKNPKYMYQHASHFYGQRNLGDGGILSNTTIHPQFTLMRRTTNYFYNVPYHVNECLNFNVDSQIEYDITPPTINVNFKEGQILLAYLGVQVDENGYRMIPNVPIVFAAVRNWIEERLAYIEYRKTKEQKDRIFWQQLVELNNKSIKMARMYLDTMTPDEWEMFIRNHWIRKVPHYTWESTHNRFEGDKEYSSRRLIGKF